MAFWRRLTDRPPSPDRFAKLAIKRIRQSGDNRPLEYDREAFQLRGESRQTYLGNLYAEYCRADRGAREAVLRTFLATWHTAGLEAPADFADVRADLLPSLRARSYAVALQELLAGGDKQTELPYEVVGEHLAATLVYDLPHAMQTVSAEQLQEWGVSFYEAMEVARHNLAETTTQYAQLGSLYALAVGDAYDASRLLLTDLIEQMETDGPAIAAVPNRERLYVVGADDEQGLVELAALVEQDLQHERAITGRLFRLTDDGWAPWLPAEDHPAYAAWRLLQVQSIGRDYQEQKARLEKQLQADGADAMVSSYQAVERQGGLETFAVLAYGLGAWLPEVEYVVLSDQRLKPVARVPWDRFREQLADRFEPMDLYPERWRLSEYPSDELLARLAQEHGL
ncbi:DUF1444 family protein [Botrimarina sp.]|uniref:DUF1444 family protein n=1 Tax=Botrimarina sp. TaxID=2795802 RepID=UPI0032EE1C70